MFPLWLRTPQTGADDVCGRASEESPDRTIPQAVFRQYQAISAPFKLRLTMNKHSNFLLLFLFATTLQSLSDADAADPPAPGDSLRVYHIGNSLTRNLPLERLQKLFADRGGEYEYGIQLGGGMRLSQHLVKRSHGGPPGSGKYNIVKRFGEYDQALKNHTFDALILQPYLETLDAKVQSLDRWPYFKAGAFQAATAFINYALGRTEPGADRWDREHANTDHVATRRFYIYATWPKAEAVLEQEGNEDSYASYWNADYQGGVQHCGDFFGQLVTELNQQFPELETPVRMIPAGAVLARLDEMIRAGELPGIVQFFERNQPYYRKARGPKAPFNPDSFQRESGVLNFYADGVHMNDQPHNGVDSGTIGSYCAALTVYATLSGSNPVGMTVEPYEMFDANKDAALIRAIQETVWDVVAGHPHTGVTKSVDTEIRR